jgi:hypothetical protein
LTGALPIGARSKVTISDRKDEYTSRCHDFCVSVRRLHELRTGATRSEIGSASADNPGNQPPVLVSTDSLDDHIGRLAVIQGQVSNSKVPTIFGVDVRASDELKDNRRMESRFLPSEL